MLRSAMYDSKQYKALDNNFDAFIGNNVSVKK